MTRNRTIFLAFTGTNLSQTENIYEIGEGYECWNLKKFSFDQFIETLKKEIPPVNKNVLRNYKKEDENATFGITEEKFKKCSWGLLIPDSLDDGMSAFPETIFLINLYSPVFLYPIFYASDFGIMHIPLKKPIITFHHSQNQSSIFTRKEFICFFKTILPQSQYGAWKLDRSKEWNKEDWRLFVAVMLYSGLLDYDNVKTSIGWQREAADMAAALEALFTAGDTQNEEVGYILRKRMAVLLSHRFSSIENDIITLYRERSAFVYGSFFAKIAKESKAKSSSLPIPNFSLLYKQKEYVRWALVAYLHLAHLMKSHPERYGNPGSVMEILERAVIDIGLRRKVLKGVETVLALLPISKDSYKV